MKFFEAGKIVAAWSQAKACQVDEAQAPGACAYAEALATEYGNGTVLFAEFDLELAMPVFQMAAHYENWKYSQFLERFWLVPGVGTRIPRLGDCSPDAGVFEPVDVFELASFLAKTLHTGGAYTRSPNSTTRAFALGTAFAQELLESEPGAAAYIAYVAWCEFFLDVAWDCTVVVVSPQAKRVKVLLATDTD